VSKFVNKFRKNNLYGDDYEYENSTKQKSKKQKINFRRIRNNDYEDMFEFYGVEKCSRKRMR
jgi:hypothetical protein